LPSSAKLSDRLAPGKPLSEVSFAVLDTETSGLSPKYGGRICEVAVVTFKGGLETGRWSTLLDPQCRIDPGAMAVHGITNAMVAGQPTFAEAVDELDALLQGTVLVAHNAPFDVNFLTAEYTRIGRVMPAVPVLCTLKLARRHFKFPSNKLGSIAAALGVEQSVAHRAMADTEALAGIFNHFLREFEKKGVTTLEGLLTL
jgi:DNA polymerase-3 subunit epsilon